MAELLSFSAPLVGLALFGALNASFDRFLLVQALGLEAVATYAAAVSLSAVPAVFYSVLGFTLFPVLARAWHGQRRDEAARLTGQALAVFLGLALPVALALAVAGPWLLPWLTTASYQAPWPVFAGQAVAVLAFGQSDARQGSAARSAAEESLADGMIAVRAPLQGTILSLTVAMLVRIRSASAGSVAPVCGSWLNPSP